MIAESQLREGNIRMKKSLDNMGQCLKTDL